jgi:uncharacterized protein (DUF983 family)
MTTPISPMPPSSEWLDEKHSLGGGKRDLWQSIRRGLLGRCPACGEGKIFYRYLKVSDFCPACGEPLHHHRADDAPPYVTILVVAHLIGAMILISDETWPEAPIWLHAMIWPTLTLILSLWLLPIFKGGLIALQWALRMHGFAALGQGEPHVPPPANPEGVSKDRQVPPAS